MRAQIGEVEHWKLLALKQAEEKAHAELMALQERAAHLRLQLENSHKAVDQAARKAKEGHAAFQQEFNALGVRLGATGGVSEWQVNLQDNPEESAFIWGKEGTETPEAEALVSPGADAVP